MTTDPIDIAFALAALQIAGACLLLLVWLRLERTGLRRARRCSTHLGAPRNEEAIESDPPAGFKPAPPRRSGGRPKSPWVRQKVLAMYEGGVATTPRGLSMAFNREHASEGVTVCKTTAHEWIVQHGARALQVRQATRNRFPRFAPANHRWCLDCTGKADEAGDEHCILGIMDHGSRFAPMMQRIARPSAWAILARLFDAIDRFGKPKFLRTDNAAVFHSAVFGAVLAAVGIRHEFIELGCPWQNRIERLFWTLKDKLNRIVLRDAKALDALLEEFAFWYNAVRPHQHLHGLTPAEAWRGIDPYRTAPKEMRRFEGWNGMLMGLYMRRD